MGPIVASSCRTALMAASASTVGTASDGRPVADANASASVDRSPRRRSASPDSWTAIARTDATAATPSRARTSTNAMIVIVTEVFEPVPRRSSHSWRARQRIAASAENAIVARNPWIAWT